VNEKKNNKMQHPHYKTREEWQSDFLLAQSRREILYGNEKGYEWLENVKAGQVKGRKELFESQGLDVLVRDDAIIAVDGQVSIAAEYRAILIRRNAEAEE
jgi:hypothetical protein